MRRCPSCGARLRGNVASCAACGAKVPWRLTIVGIVVESGLVLGLVVLAVGLVIWWRDEEAPSGPQEQAFQGVISREPTGIPTFTPPPPPSATRPPSTEVPPTETPLPPVIEYAIQSGDTLFGLGLEYGVTLEEIGEANPEITDFEGLSIGQVIRIPVRRDQEEAPSEGEAVAAAPDAGDDAASSEAEEGTDPADGDAEAAPAAEGGEPGADTQTGGDAEPPPLSLAEAEPTGAPIVVQEAVSYTLAFGDTLGRIAAEHEVSVDQIIEWNGLSGPAGLFPGDEIVVQPAVVVTTTPAPTTPPTSVPAVGPADLSSGAMIPAEDVVEDDSLRIPAPRMLSPGGASVVTSDAPVLRWASSGVLPEGVYYVVAIRDLSAPDAEPYYSWIRTNATAARIPGRLRPNIGVERELAWSVTVRREPTGLLSESEGVVLSGEPEWRRFVWAPGGNASPVEPEPDAGE